MMDARYDRKQMTKGIWMAKAADVDPLTIVLDIEGNDGRERGQGHPFERRTALFALALADILLINMWCNDIGRDAGANKPLLRTVFEAMAQSFSPSKTTLLFVIRDKPNLTPLSYLQGTLDEDLKKIWAEVKKREEYKTAAFSDFFSVQFTSLCNYEYVPDEFIKEVAELKKRFQNSIAPGGIAGEREGRVPGSAFSLSVETLWKSIQDNKNLDLPSHKIMVATVRCQDIAKNKLSQLRNDQSWSELLDAAKSGPVPNFGKQISSIVASYLSVYDKEVMYFDKAVRDDVRRQFEKDIFEVVKPTYKMLLEYHRFQSESNFQAQLMMMQTGGKGFADSVRHCTNSCLLDFDKQCQDVDVGQAAHWNAENVRRRLLRAIEDFSSTLRESSLSQIVASCERNLSDKLERAVIQAMEATLLEDRSGESCWPWTRSILLAETDTATSEFMSLVAGFELDDSTCMQLLERIRKHGRGIVEKKAKEEGARVLFHMKNRFHNCFSQTTDFMPRQWTADEDITSITRESRSACLKILSDLAIIRLEETPDNVQETLFMCLMNESNINLFNAPVPGHPLSSKTWENVPSRITIITPIQCKSIWKQLLRDTINIIRHAHETQGANKLRDAAIAAAEAANREVLAKQEATAIAAAEAAKREVLAKQEATAIAAAEAAKREVLAKQEAAAAAERAKIEAVGAAAAAKVALTLAKARAEVAAEQAEIAKALARKSRLSS